MSNPCPTAYFNRAQSSRHTNFVRRNESPNVPPQRVSCCQNVPAAADEMQRETAQNAKTPRTARLPSFFTTVGRHNANHRRLWECSGPLMPITGADAFISNAAFARTGRTVDARRAQPRQSHPIGDSSGRRASSNGSRPPDLIATLPERPISVENCIPGFGTRDSRDGIGRGRTMQHSAATAARHSIGRRIRGAGQPR